MDTVKILSREFLAQDFTDGQPPEKMLDGYRRMASCYAQIENAIAVLSDMYTNASYIYYGGFAQTLGIGPDNNRDRIHSIWEKEIFSLIHPDDLKAKHLHELCFLNFIRQRPKRKRTDYYLASKLNMKNRTGCYIPVLHRMFYVPTPSHDNLWLALCLYSPLVADIPAKGLIINSRNGEVKELEQQDSTGILSERERQVLGLIQKGLTSKEIANMLSISINTVSRHRQDILSRLQVKNSIEACRIAKDLKLI